MCIQIRSTAITISKMWSDNGKCPSVVHCEENDLSFFTFRYASKHFRFFIIGKRFVIVILL